MLRLLVMAAAVIALLAAIVLGTIWREPWVDAERLTQTEMEALVQAPVDQVQAGDLAGGRRTFERMLRETQARHGPNALEAADLLTSFGILLHLQEDDIAPKAVAAGYLRRAIPIYRAVLGPDHPEVATALNSLADSLRYANPDNPPAEAEAALVEAYRIRMVSRGPSHAETLWTILYLSDIRGRPARTGGDPARIAAVLADLDRAARLSRNSDRVNALQIPVEADLRRALILARNRRPAEAVRAFSAAVRRARASRDDETCLWPMTRSNELAEVLEAQGEAQRAETVRQRANFGSLSSACG